MIFHIQPTFVDGEIPHFEWIHNSHCVAGFSTRKGGISTGVYESMNTGLHSKDEHHCVIENRDKFFSSVASTFKVANLRQIHSAKIVEVNNSFTNDCEADGFFTTEKNVVLSISIADCGSVLFHDEKFSIIAGLHCGWRGTRDGIIQNMVKILSKFVNPQNLTAYIGPMISKENYEVGKEFYDFFPKQYLIQKDGSHYFDLNGRVESILQECNIGKIYNPRIDTFSNKELFYSYRRDGVTGRMCAYIGKR